MRFIKRFAFIIALALFVMSCTEDQEEPVTLSTVSITATIAEASETGTDGEIKVGLSSSPGIPTQVNLTISGTATNGTDYQLIDNIVTIPANQLSISIPVRVLTDDLDEGTETVIVTIESTANSSIKIGDQNSATITISDPSGSLIILKPEDTRSYMANPNATDETVSLFYNLKTISLSHFIVGQQDAFNSFYNDNSGDSDIKKTTGQDPGLLGSDFLFITDDQNDETPENWFYQQEQIIIADVKEAYNKGMVNAFCWHFREPYEGKSFYTSDMTAFQKENAFKSILPGGANHEYYKQKLDKIAKVANSLIGDDGKLIPFIFRPFHEFDRDWFWWGQSFCTPEEFISLWRFTVEYLRDIKGINNMLFAFSPDNSMTSASDYLARYPGDDYVDILAMDNYSDFFSLNEAGMEAANNKLQIISTLANERVKIAALSESGYQVNDGQVEDISGFYSNYLYNALTKDDVKIGFIMFWYNGSDYYYTPVPGLNSTDDFIDFVDQPASWLADDLPDMYSLP